ncbi:MAG: Hpt domain-containing protein [Acidobacteria bacterium]|nr:Hpt domain-containing protein [Acidobacteriota bacterium]
MTGPAFDEQVLRGWTRGNPKLLARVIEQFRADRDEFLAQLGQARATGDAAALAGAAHSIKGVVATLGGRAAAVAAAEVERLARDRADVSSALATLEREIDGLAAALARLGEDPRDSQL